MNKKFNSEGYRLRAEELRAIASELDRPETRRILLAIAEDYDRLANSARLLIECRDRLTAVSEELERPVAQAANGNGSGDNGVQACRTMARDAERLSGQSEGSSRDAWLQLSERWHTLADKLEETDAQG
jgi:hypothetical protein